MAKLKELRERKGLTRKELAIRTGIDYATLYKLEKGQLIVYPGWRKRLAQALGVKEEELECDGEK